MIKPKLVTSLLGLAATMSASTGQDDRGADAELLPKVPEGFEYNSETNKDWMTAEELLQWLKNNQHKLGTL